MEESEQQQTLKLLEIPPFPFPPHRRRPIRSNTYFNLIQLLSHCRPAKSQLNDGGTGEVELRRGSPEDARISPDPSRSSNLLVSNEILVQGLSGKSKGSVSLQDGGVDGVRIALPGLEGVNLVFDGLREVTQTNGSNVGNFLVEENQDVDFVVKPANERENLDSVLEFHAYDSDPVRLMKVDDGFSIDDFCEVLDSCYGGDEAVESTKFGEDIKQSKEVKHLVHLKEMELEKHVSTLGAADLSSPVIEDGEIEEGEIYRDSEVSVWSVDTLPKDGATAAEIIDFPEDNVDKKKSLSNNEYEELLKHDACIPSLTATLDNANSCRKVELRTSTRQMQDTQPENILRNDYLETRIIEPSTENIPLFGRSLQENATEDSISAIGKKDFDDNKRKRKNGPLTKERRAKKKLKSRIKRAEKNRKLGVKRLKLQPVSMPKKIVYCRHYLQGRCHEGEKCKFSHDTTPLTKSKPCGHFARHSCMKGDDCPFDHQLSKYPCNNYASTGFCSRGADCLFSHEVLISSMPEKQVMPTASNVMKTTNLKSEQLIMPDKEGTSSKVSETKVMFFPRMDSSDFNKPVDIPTFHEKLDIRFSCAKDSSCKSVTTNLAKPFLRTVAQAPKGISFFPNSSMSAVGNSKLGLDRAIQKAGDKADIGHEAGLKGLDSIIQVNKEASPKLRGINFLSFVQPSMEDSSNKIFSNLHKNSFKPTGNPVMADSGEVKQAPLPKSDNSSRVNYQTSQTETSFASNLNQRGKYGPMTPLPSHMNFPSHCSFQAYASALKGDVSLSGVENKLSSPGKLPPQTPLLAIGGGSWDQPTSAAPERKVTTSSKASLFSNSPSLVQKAVQSALAFAAKFDTEIQPPVFSTHGEA